MASTDSIAQSSWEGGWQEEIFQKIKTMKEKYLSELNEMRQKISTKLEQSDSLPQQPKTDKIEKLRVFKMMLERIISFLQVSKSNILPNYKEKLGSYEKQIINFINANRPREVMSSMQPQGQVPPTHMHSMLQPQQQSQVIQVQSHENQMNSQFQSESVRCSVSSDGKLISELREEISNLQSSLSEEVKNLKDKLQKMEDDRRKEKEEWSLKMKGLTKEISELKEKVETREHQHSLARAELLREIENLQGEKASSSSQVVHQWI